MEQDNIAQTELNQEANQNRGVDQNQGQRDETGAPEGHPKITGQNQTGGHVTFDESTAKEQVKAARNDMPRPNPKDQRSNVMPHHASQRPVGSETPNRHFDPLKTAPVGDSLEGTGGDDHDQAVQESRAALEAQAANQDGNYKRPPIPNPGPDTVKAPPEASKHPSPEAAAEANNHGGDHTPLSGRAGVGGEGAGVRGTKAA